MAQGLAGDTPGTTAGDQTLQLQLVEARVQSEILQGLAPTADELRQLRNDIGADLGITPLPIPGS